MGMGMDIRDVKYVGAYLRKSRGDEDKALEKHRKDLTDLAARHGWTVEWYEEIGSSDSIDFRPEIQRLLRDVQSDLYDAVLVMDLDRFSRGDLSDQARWRHAFESTRTLIVTPTNVYDLAQDQTALLADIEGMFARFEYKMIAKRLRQGKVTGAKLGRWTNGPAPMPYRYDAATKLLVVVPDQLTIYEHIKRRFLDNVPPYKIAVDLNQQGVKSAKGGKWQPSTIHRLLLSEVHLGRVVMNKTAGSAHSDRKTKPYRRRDRDEWIISEGGHQPVKTPEEHARILAICERRKLIKRRARSGQHVLSGIVRCGLCGATMQIMQKATGRVEVRKCMADRELLGRPCQNRGCSVEAVYVELNTFMRQYYAELSEQAAKGGKRSGLSGNQLEARQQELKELDEGASRIEDLYVMGRIKTKEELQAKLNAHDKLVQEKRKEITRLREIIREAGLTPKERLQRVQDFLDVWPNGASLTEQNRRLRQVADSVVYTRIGDEITVTVKPV